MEAAMAPIGDLPRYLVPCYFDAIVTGTHQALLNRTWSLMSRYFPLLLLPISENVVSFSFFFFFENLVQIR